MKKDTFIKISKYLVFVSLIIFAFMLCFVGSGWGGVYYIGTVKISMRNLKNMGIMFYIFMILAILLQRKDTSCDESLKPTPFKSKRFIAGYAVALLIVFYILYKKIIFSFFVGDDFLWLDSVKNNFLSNLLSIDQYSKYIKFFRPLLSISIYFNYKISTFNPVSYHLLNIILHLINCIFVFLVSYYLFFNKKVSLFVSLIFATMPIQSETVNWLSARADLLVSTFYLLALLAFILYRLYDRKIYILISMLSFIFSLLSKEVGISLPFILLVYDSIFWFKYLKEKRNKLLVHLYFLSILFMYFYLRFAMYGDVGGYQKVGGGTKLLTLNFGDFFRGIFLDSFVSFFFPVNWLSVQRHGLVWVKYFVFAYALTIFLTIIFNSYKIIRSRTVIFSLLLIFITSLSIAGLWGIGSSLHGSRFYYLIMFGFYLFITAMLFGQRDRLATVTATSLIVLNLVFLNVNNLSWERIGRQSFAILKQTKSLYPTFFTKTRPTIYFYGFPASDNGVPCIGDGVGNGVSQALSFFYDSNPPLGIRLDNRLVMVNFRKIPLAESVFVLKWNDKKEALIDLTAILKNALTYKIDDDFIKRENTKIKDIAQWEGNGQVKQLLGVGRFRILGMDGWLDNLSISIPARSSPSLVIKMKVIPADKKYFAGYYAGKLYWATDKHNEFNDERFVDFWISPKPDYNDYIINFIGPDEILNNETVTKFRLMPTVFPAEVDIAEIKLEY